MARALERKWPGVVTVGRRFKRPQHQIVNAWTRFRTPLKLKPGIDLAKLPKVDNLGLVLKDTSQDVSPPKPTKAKKAKKAKAVAAAPAPEQSTPT
jgi:hypothetical protein